MTFKTKSTIESIHHQHPPTMTRKRRRISSFVPLEQRWRLRLLWSVVLVLSVSKGGAWIVNLRPRLRCPSSRPPLFPEVSLVMTRHAAGRRPCPTSLCASKRGDSHRHERRNNHRLPYRLGGQAFSGTPKEQQQHRDDIDESLSAPLARLEETQDATSVTNSVPTIRPSKDRTRIVNETLTLAVNTTDPPPLSLERPRSTGSPSSFFSTWPITALSAKSSLGTSSGLKKKKKKANPKELSLLPNKDRDAVITLGDLEQILEANGYVKRSELETDRFSRKSTPSLDSSTGVSKTVPLTKSGVAMPQLSVLSYRDLTVGCTIAAGAFGMVLSSTVLPNLWLIGALFGGIYGYDLSQKAREKQPTFVLNNLIVLSGRKLAKGCLFVYDAVNGLWFMYRTGQLSYSYYKQYSRLDQRFAISDKVDAWNARFQEGKANFDRWEQENEVGRRVLAGMRTAWLVGERRRGKRRSKYRVVQSFYDVSGWVRRLMSAVWNSATGGGGSELREVMRGIRIDVSESRMNEIGPRIGAATTALVTIYMVGALYSLSARLLGFLAILTGLVWPTWVIELGDRFRVLFSELRARGRGEELPPERKNRRPSSSRLASVRYDKNRYHYFTRQDGSKRWYRTGRPVFRSKEPVKTQGPWWSTGSDRFLQSSRAKGNQDDRKLEWNLVGRS